MPYSINPFTKKFDYANFSSAIARGILSDVTTLSTSVATLEEEVRILDTTTEDVTYFVNEITGNDENSGSEASPLASVVRARALLPRTFAHNAVIKVLSDLTEFPSDLYLPMESGGSFSIIGVGEAVVTAGPFEITNVVAIGSAGHKCTVALGALDITNEFVRFTDGDAAGVIFRVTKSTETTFDMVLTSTPPSNNSHFEVVRPAISVAVDHKVSIYLDCQGQNTDLDSQFVMCNLGFDFSSMTPPAYTAEPLKILGSTYGRESIRLPFVRVDVPTGFYVATALSCCSLNTLAAANPNIELDSGVTAINLDTEWENAGTILTSPDAACLDASGNEGVYIANFSAPTLINYGSAISFSAAAFTATTTNSYVSESGYSCVLAYHKFEGCRGRLLFDCAHFSGPTNAIEVRDQTCLELTDVSLDNVSGVAVTISACANVVLQTACTSFVGSAGAYTFLAPNVAITTALWPTKGVGATDAMGAWVVYTKA
jgi:hypothetical protein